ncbi:hypothetical protein F3Y22_tig00110258pilonHSYRG00008 [Hibiscus syriacus]|uniref:Agenet-like domain-containing protein n=1 Tax=Hibiscus syriacus TaxID=106335 RepID=A0A6A3B9U9_HIBSY|nr:hypothetical protein F3Y22_tig00110258pilonHSYRG00008 [Hibiscus syriacus]
MNFRRGNSVEVLRREDDDDDPCESWFTGIVVSADGENYVVRCNLLIDHRGKQVMEKLQRKTNDKKWVPNYGYPQNPGTSNNRIRTLADQSTIRRPRYQKLRVPKNPGTRI